MSSTVYTAQITPNGSGDITIVVPANVALDGGSNGNDAATPATARYNTVPVADASTAQSVNEAVSVTLSSATAASPTFTAPTLATTRL